MVLVSASVGVVNLARGKVTLQKGALKEGPSPWAKLHDIEGAPNLLSTSE